jgi:FkbM family methyltransferase
VKNLDNIEREKLVLMLDEINKKFRESKIKKFLKYPIWTVKVSLISRLLHNLLRDRFKVHSYVNLFFGERMYLTYPPNYSIKFYTAYVEADAEVRATKFLIRNLKEGDIFFDIGASQGYYTILASRLVGISGKVYAFEPEPHSLNILTKNKRDNVIIVDKAVTYQSGEFYFYLYRYSTRSSLKAYAPYRRKIKVKGIDLDSFCHYEGIIPNCMKIDIEGGEEDALRGAMKILKNYSPVILMEIHFKPLKEVYRNSIQILKSNGYMMFSIDDAGSLKRIDFENLDGYFTYLSDKYSKIRDKTSFDNIVFIKQ